jgi:HAE1 family hydrophobic/amphiphilic exporter-1
MTLFTTPVVYLYLDRFSNAISRWTSGSRPQQPSTDIEDLKHAAE